MYSQGVLYYYNISIFLQIKSATIYNMKSRYNQKLSCAKNYEHPFKDERNIVSIPLNHEKPSNRLLVITNHQRNGQVFLILQDNMHAQFIIHNELPIKLWFLMANIKGMHVLYILKII